MIRGKRHNRKDAFETLQANQPSPTVGSTARRDRPIATCIEQIPVKAVSSIATARIVFLLPFLVQGALPLAILRALRARGADVAVAYCLAESAGYTPDLAADFAAEGLLIDLSSLQTRSHFDHLAHTFVARGTKLVVQIGAFDLYPVLPYLKEQNPTLRLIDVLYNESGHTLNHFLYENCFDGVIVESQHMRKFVERSTTKSTPNIRVVENGIDLGDFAPAPVGTHASEGLHIGYIGRLSPEKNPLGFIDLAEALGAMLPALRFSLHGEGMLADSVRSRVSASPLGDRLAYRGRTANVAGVLATLDVLVVPSILDGRPNVVMEANACGVPVIGAAVGGIPELIEDGRNGILAAPTEFDRIASVLSNWANHPAALDYLRLECRRVAEARFDWHRMIGAYEAAFEAFIAL